MEPSSSDFDLVLFRQRLKETIRWCRYKIAQSKTHTSEVLWSLADPSLIRTNYDRISGRDIFHWPKYGESWRSEEWIEDYCDKVFALRSQRLTMLPESSQIVPDDSLMGGRLLMFFIHGTLSDGFAERESEEFFDANNLPACDTWVYLYRTKDYIQLISWVPLEFFEDVDRGISGNPEECINWLDADVAIYWTSSLTIQLKAVGLLPHLKNTD